MGDRKRDRQRDAERKGGEAGVQRGIGVTQREVGAARPPEKVRSQKAANLISEIISRN